MEIEESVDEVEQNEPGESETLERISDQIASQVASREPADFSDLKVKIRSKETGEIVEWEIPYPRARRFTKKIEADLRKLEEVVTGPRHATASAALRSGRVLRRQLAHGLIEPLISTLDT